MANYDTYPAVDDSFNFPPEVRQAIAGAAELKDVFIQRTRGTLPDQTALNTLNTANDIGNYSLLDSYTFYDIPSGYSGGAVLEVLRGSGPSAMLQRITSGTSLFWREASNSTSWSNWEQVTNRSRYDTKINDLVAWLTDKDTADDEHVSRLEDLETSRDALEAKQAVICVRFESPNWVWDTVNGTHFLILDTDGDLVVRATAQPVPALTPELNW